jgi:hypothetical protein
VRTKAGRYSLEDRVLDGRGWSYWCGYDSLLRRPVGVLALEPGNQRADQVLAAARAGAAVEDPRIQRVLDVLTDEEGTCLVIEWTPGTTVEDLLAEGPLADVESWRVALDVARALANVHALGLQHGAIGPRWVLRGDGGRVRVLGLCIAAQLDGDPDRPLDDVTGLGQLLYACLTARWPGDPAACTLPAAPMQAGRAPRPSRVRAGVPPALDDLVARSLGLTTRSAPPESAAAFALALEVSGSRMRGFDASEPVDLDPEVLAELVDTGYVQRVTDAANAEPSLPGAPEPARQRRGRGGRLLAAVAALAALSVLAGFWLTTRPAATAAPAAGPTVTEAPSTATTAAPTGAIVPIHSVKDFDPLGNGTENPGQVPFAWDHNPATAWHTVTYFNRPDLGGLKSGVGLLVDLGARLTVGAVKLQLVGYGTWVQLRVGPSLSNDPNDYVPVAHADNVGQLITLRPDQAQLTRYLLIWLTRLPVAPNGQGYSGGVAEIEVYSG